MAEGKMSEKGMILVISGPSGTGKGTILEQAVKSNSNLRYSVSATTRKPRPGEIPDVSYFYKTREEFDEMISSGEILEWDEFCCNRYGTPRTPLARAIEGGADVIMDITVPGAMAVKKSFPEDSVTVFILPPSLEELERRLRGRNTETEEEITRRLGKASDEIGQQDHFQYQLVNDDVKKAADRLLEILAEAKRNRAEKARNI